MSASLVGSEMCIRDRRAQRKVGRSAILHEQTYSIIQHACVGLHVGRCGAVSYTHLTLPTICSV
eukprot:5481692-Alexandrium_andersonii.AAC.1